MKMPIKNHTFFLLFCIMMITLSMTVVSCKKNASANPARTDTTTSESQNVTDLLHLTRKWILSKVELPESGTTWLTRNDSSPDVDTITFGGDGSVTVIDNKNIYNGQWHLSTDDKLLGISLNSQSETDTIVMLNDQVLQLIVPGKFTYGSRSYSYERETYEAK